MKHTNITLTETELRVNGKTVAVLADRESYTLLSDALYGALRKDESVYLALCTLSESRKSGVRTSEVANFLSMDRSNCTKALERLLEDGRIKVIGSTEEGERGRPSRLWFVA